MEGKMAAYFKLEERGTNYKTEIMAGATTFMTMAYILSVNPSILSTTGMDIGAVFTATALAAIIATVMMALWANLPFALAPGMGLNAFFAFTVVAGMGYTWQYALTAVFIEGILFILMSIFNIREAIVDAIPLSIKHAISVGIGLFIAFIGLSNAGVVIQGEGIPLTLGDISAGAPLLAILGIIFTGILVARRVKGALLIGIFATTLAGVPLGITQLPTSLLSLPPSLAPTFMQLHFSLAEILTWDMLFVVLSFLFLDIFDTVGTLVGVADKAGMLDKEGKLPKVKQALMADAIGTTTGALLGTSTITTYVESASGVSEGGRTGLTALATAAFFAMALFFAPVFIMIPAVATAPALVLVGLFMIEPIRHIDLKDFTEALPAFIVIIIMPMAYSISAGIFFGIISYVLIKLACGRYKDITWLTYILAVLFVFALYFN
jgi:AGZA family xanthine/uracil permease-like MFS transporter